MKYKVKLSVKIMMFSCLLLAGVASANSVTKTLYVDGVRVGASGSTDALGFPYPRLTIGSEGNMWYRYNGLIGSIDEFAVYNGVLTESQISTHYGAGAGGYVAAVNADSPVLYLRFEDASSAEGQKAANSGTGIDVNATYIGTVALGAGYVGNAAVLGSPDANDCIDVCDWDQQLTLYDVSIEFWVNTTQATDYPRFFQHNGDTTVQDSYGAMYVASTNSVGLIGGGSTEYLGAVLNDGNWHHVVVTFDTLVNPELIGSLDYEAEVLADDPCVYLKFDHPLMVDSSENHYWAGYSVRSANPAIIRPAAGAIGGSAFYCDNSFTAAGADTRAYTWNEGGISGQGVSYWREFPGWTDAWGDQYLITETDYYGSPKTSRDATYELWMKQTPELTSEQWANILQQQGGWEREPNAPFIGLTDGHDPNIAGLRVGGGSTFWYPGVTGILDGDWHHIVVTYDENEVDPGGSLGLQIYVDGVLRSATTIYDPVNKRAKQGNSFGTSGQSGLFYTLMLGAANNVGYAYSTYGGWLDEVAVYSGVLSAERIAVHYAAAQPRDCADVIAKGLKYPGDMDGDCDVDLTDFALFAQGWALCNNPAGCP
jgi:hypothetical protein